MQTTRVQTAEPKGDHEGYDVESARELAAVRALLQVRAPSQADEVAPFGRRMVEVLVGEVLGALADE